MLHEYIVATEAHIKDKTKRGFDIYDVSVVNRLSDCHAIVQEYAAHKRLKWLPLAESISTKSKNKSTVVQFKFADLDVATLLESVAESGLDDRASVRELDNTVILEIE